jgi:hypothetical protein
MSTAIHLSQEGSMNTGKQPQSEISVPEKGMAIPVGCTAATLEGAPDQKAQSPVVPLAPATVGTRREVSTPLSAKPEISCINMPFKCVQPPLYTQIPKPVHEVNLTWLSMDEAVVGLAHRAKNVPCQDAAIALHTSHPFMVLADGAGSAVASDIGAQAVVTGLARLIQTLEFQWVPLLDAAELDDTHLPGQWPMRLMKHARGILDDTAKIHRREVRDLRCTLLCALVGRERFLWFKVGDGEIIVERTQWDNTEQPLRQYQVLGERGKGDFANQTTFIDVAKPEDVQWGIESIQTVSGLAAMSDGAAEKLVAFDGSKVATRLGNILDNLRNQNLKRQDLTKLFYSPEFCERSSGDDRSMTVLARHVARPIQPAAPLLDKETLAIHVEVVQEGVVACI